MISYVLFQRPELQHSHPLESGLVCSDALCEYCFQGSWSDEKVSAVDMDLDLIRFAGEDEIILDDEDEFLENSQIFNYPKELIDMCRIEAEFCEKKCYQGKGSGMMRSSTGVLENLFWIIFDYYLYIIGRSNIKCMKSFH